MRNLKSFWSFAPDPNGGAYSAPPYPWLGREGATPPPAPTPFCTVCLIRPPPPPLTDNPGSATESCGCVRKWEELVGRGGMVVFSGCCLLSCQCERSGCHCIILSRIIMQPAMIGATVCLHGPNFLTFW